MRLGRVLRMFRVTLGLWGLIAVSSSSVFGQQTRSAPPNGEAIFLVRCSHCHGDKGQGVNAPITFAGPNIQAEHNPGMVMWAMEVGPSHMPRFSYVLSVEEMRSVAEYVTKNLAVIPLSGGDLVDGGALFRVYCATCHRAVVRGGALVFTDINAPKLTNKSKALVAGAIRWGPGPMPSFPKSILSDEQVASIVDYIDFAKEPPSPGGSALHWNGPVSEGFVAWVIAFGMIALTVWIERGGKG